MKFAPLLCILVFFCSQASGAERLSMSLSSCLRLMKNRNIVIEFTIKNNETYPIITFGSQLPWDTRSSINLIIILDVLGFPRVNEIPAIDDAPFVISEIAPSETKVGVVNLTERFRDSNEKVKGREAIVFYSYQCNLFGKNEALAFRDFLTFSILNGGLLSNRLCEEITVPDLSGQADPSPFRMGGRKLEVQHLNPR